MLATALEHLPTEGVHLQRVSLFNLRHLLIAQQFYGNMQHLRQLIGMLFHPTACLIPCRLTWLQMAGDKLLDVIVDLLVLPQDLKLYILQEINPTA